MAVDRNTIVTIYKKGESNSCIAKKLHICHETVWKVVKKFKETGETCNWPGQGRKWPFRTKHLVKNMREKLRRNSYWCKNGCRSRNKSNFNASNPQRRTRTYPYKMQKRHELSTTPEHMRLDRCQHILNLMKDRMVPNLVFTDEKKFDVQQCLNHQNDRVWSRDGSVEGRRVSWRQNPLSVMVWVAITATGRSLIFVSSGVKLNSPCYILDILEAELLPWGCKYFDGAPWTL